MPQLNELIKVNTIYDLAKISFMWYNAIQQITNEKFKELMNDGLFIGEIKENKKYEWKLQNHS